MNPLEYLHLQLRLEGKEVVDGDRLRQVEVVPDEEMPLMLVAQLAGGQLAAYYDESLQPELHLELVKQIQGIVFPEMDVLIDVLKAQNISFEVGHYKTYVFPGQFAEAGSDDVKCLSRDDPRVQEFGFGNFAEQIYVIERHGKAVSACVSTRENKFCGEAWVYTDEAHRKRGFAQHVVQAWARGMVQAGKVPFYSHKIENTASANLAKRLGLKPVFEEISIAYMHV